MVWQHVVWHAVVWHAKLWLVLWLVVLGCGVVCRGVMSCVVRCDVLSHGKLLCCVVRRGMVWCA